MNEDGFDTCPNRAYERWWEARTQWGTLVNVSRNLAIKIRELVRPDEAETKEACGLIVAHCYVLMDHLREDIKLATIAEYLDDETLSAHEPAYVVRRIYALFQRWVARGQVSEQALWVLDREARTFLDVCGACERIAHYVEEPLGQCEDHLNLHAICGNIEKSVAEIFSQEVKS